MTSLTFLGEFPQVALALAFSFACALVMAFALSADRGSVGDTRTV